MLDLKLIRENPDLVLEALEKRHDSAPLEGILDLDAQHRKLLYEVETLRARRKEASREIGESVRMGKETDKPPPPEGVTTPEEVDEKVSSKTEEMRGLGARVKALDKQIVKLEEQLRDLLLQIPNIPHPSVPLGSDERDNALVRSWGETPRFDFQPLSHWELGERLDIIDFPRGVKLSGTRFYVLKGLGARLQRALITFMLDLHIGEHGYTEVYPPFMVKRQCMVGSGNLPKFAGNLYHDEEDDFWFVPTAEVPLTGLHSDEILEPGSLPLYYIAYTACFRRERMSAGKDTRGIKRGHQFDKVELYKLVPPESSGDELEKLVRDAEEVCRRLNLPYRVTQLCTADLGFSAAKAYDIEVWAPGCAEWLEVSSCSNCGDFQARRANIRYRPAPGARPQFVHTLNGSGLALPRILIAILESYQQPDGSVIVPEVLQPFMGSAVIG
jgi:seryl-tRNA synthetase